MSNGFTMLDSPFKNAKPSAAFAQLNPQEENLADGIGSSYGVIRYKGKVWTLGYRGEKHIFTRPDDGSPSNYIDVVILRQAHTKSKSYYGKYDPNASEGARPICASLNGIVPDPDVQQKQAEACAICKRNEFVTNADGRKTRDCTDYKRLAVLIMPAQTQRMLSTPLMEPVFLRIPPASLNDLAVFGETMAGQGWHFSSFVTRISFDPNQPHPKMVFTPLQALTDAEAPIVLQLRNDQQAMRITGEANPLADRQLPPPQQAAAPQLVQQSVSTGFMQAQPPVQQAPKMIDVTPTVLPANNFTPAPAAAAPVADTGEPAEANAALNERVKKLLQLD